MPGDLILDVGKLRLTFRRCDAQGGSFNCTFCERNTFRGIAHSANLRDWSFLPACDECFSAVKNLPVRDGDKA